MSTPLWVSATRGTSVGTATIEADDDTFTLTAHGLVNGQQVTVATLTGGATSVLVADAPYFVASAAANTFQLRPSPGAPVMTFASDGGCAVYQAAGLMDAQSLRDGMSGLLGRGDVAGGFGARPGVFPQNAVGSHVTTSGMTWTVSDLVAVVQHSTGRMYIVAHPTEGGAVTAADPSNDRIDAIDLQIQDNVLDSSGFARGRIVYTAGTPSATPVAPAATPNAERLSTFTVAAGATSTGAPAAPRFTTARGGTTPVADSSAYPGTGGRYEGMMLWNSATDQLVVNMNGSSTWSPIASPTSFQSERRIATTIRTTNTSTFTAETLINSVTASLENGKTYRVRWMVDVSSTVALDLARLRLRQDSLAGAEMQLINRDIPGTTTDYPAVLEAEYTAGSTGSKTFVGTCVRQVGTGNLACNANATQPHYLYVDYIRG